MRRYNEDNNNSNNDSKEYHKKENPEDESRKDQKKKVDLQQNQKQKEISIVDEVITSILFSLKQYRKLPIILFPEQHCWYQILQQLCNDDNVKGRQNNYYFYDLTMEQLLDLFVIVELYLTTTNRNIGPSIVPQQQQQQDKTNNKVECIDIMKQQLEQQQQQQHTKIVQTDDRSQKQNLDDYDNDHKTGISKYNHEVEMEHKMIRNDEDRSTRRSCITAHHTNQYYDTPQSIVSDIIMKFSNEDAHSIIRTIYNSIQKEYLFRLHEQTNASLDYVYNKTKDLNTTQTSTGTMTSDCDLMICHHHCHLRLCEGVYSIVDIQLKRIQDRLNIFNRDTTTNSSSSSSSSSTSSATGDILFQGASIIFQTLYNKQKQFMETEYNNIFLSLMDFKTSCDIVNSLLRMSIRCKAIISELLLQYNNDDTLKLSSSSVNYNNNDKQKKVLVGQSKLLSDLYTHHAISVMQRVVYLRLFYHYAESSNVQQAIGNTLFHYDWLYTWTQNELMKSLLCKVEDIVRAVECSFIEAKTTPAAQSTMLVVEKVYDVLLKAVVIFYIQCLLQNTTTFCNDDNINSNIGNVWSDETQKLFLSRMYGDIELIKQYFVCHLSVVIVEKDLNVLEMIHKFLSQNILPDPLISSRRSSGNSLSLSNDNIPSPYENCFLKLFFTLQESLPNPTELFLHQHNVIFSRYNDVRHNKNMAEKMNNMA